MFAVWSWTGKEVNNDGGVGVGDVFGCYDIMMTIVIIRKRFHSIKKKQNSIPSSLGVGKSLHNE